MTKDFVKYYCNNLRVPREYISVGGEIQCLTIGRIPL
jgi:hypothetical protein